MMAYTNPEELAEEEEEEGQVQEVQLTGTFLCGSRQFKPEAVYLREFFWETGVKDSLETIDHHPSKDPNP